MCNKCSNEASAGLEVELPKEQQSLEIRQKSHLKSQNHTDSRITRARSSFRGTRVLGSGVQMK